ncbi:hypothetical protein BJ165DRAFT_1593652, partial [Panaeolus papilionaceus]
KIRSCDRCSYLPRAKFNSAHFTLASSLLLHSVFFFNDILLSFLFVPGCRHEDGALVVNSEQLDGGDSRSRIVVSRIIRLTKPSLQCNSNTITVSGQISRCWAFPWSSEYSQCTSTVFQEGSESGLELEATPTAPATDAAGATTALGEAASGVE